jgi:hypothetical protein
MKKKLLWVGIGILILLVLTNPSLSDFKDAGHQGSHKKMNYLIFSTFEESIPMNGYNYRQNTYLGICKNFILLDGDGPYRPTVTQWK